MKEKIEHLLNEIAAFTTDKKEELEQYRLKYLSKKGIIPSLFGEFKIVAPELRKDMGQALNDLKNKAQDKFNDLQSKIDDNPSFIDCTK